MLRIFLICTALLFGLSHQTNAQKYLRIANKNFELSEYALAIEGLERHVRKDPNASAERGKLAYAQRMMGQLSSAEENYAQLVKQEGSNPEYAFQYALVLMESGKYGAAVEQLSVAASLGHPQAEAVASRLLYAQANLDQLSGWKVSNEFANTKFDDYLPTTSGDFVVYASDKDGVSKLYRTNRDNNKFLRVPQELHKTIVEGINQGPIAYSPSGQLVAYTRNNFTNGERLLPDAGWELSLMLSTTAENGDFIEGKPFVHNGPGFSTGFPAFSPDGDKLYFSSNRPGGEGGYDIYVSKRTDSGWGAPENLGPQVNTPGNEIAPSAFGESIYFSSDYLPGYGGMDIYRADLMGKVVTGVANLGSGVNSPLDDVGFSVSSDGQFAYFTSNRAGGKGGQDVYRAMRNGKSLIVAIVDGKTGAPIQNALLDFSNCNQGNFLTGVDGAYVFRAVEALDCRPTVRKSGYNSKQFSITAKNLKDNQRLEIRLNPEDKLTIYEGKVIHSRTGDLIPNVKISAQQKGGTYTAESTTDANGFYELKLEREAAYVVSYQAPGMATIDREISTADTEGAGILSTFAMFPLGAPVAVNNSRIYTAPSEAQGLMNSTSSPVPATDSSTEVEETTVAGSVAAGFAVQVAALAETATDISEYQTKLGSLGQVYGKRENGVLRVRIGPFDSRTEAATILARAKALGFSDAFIAKENGGGAVGIDKVVRKVKPSPARESSGSSFNYNATDGKAVAVSSEPQAVNSESNFRRKAGASAGSYLIRLATYGNLLNFDANKVAHIGTITTRKRGDYTVVLIQGFSSPDEAESKIDLAKQAGFDDAHVVFEGVDGSLQKVR